MNVLENTYTHTHTYIATRSKNENCGVSRGSKNYAVMQDKVQVNERN